MKYFQSTGFFCLLYLGIFWCLSFGVSILIPNSQITNAIVYVGIALCGILFTIISGKDIKKTLRLHKMHVGSIILVILMSLTIRPFASLISQMGTMIFQDITTSSINRQLSNGLIPALTTMAFLPGLVEEMTFRGIIYSGLRKANPIKGILLSALFFGLAHMNFQQFCYAFFLGLVFGLVIEATDSIFSTMLMHMCFNGLSVAISYIMYHSGTLSKILNSSTVAQTTTWDSVIILIPSAFLGAVLSILLFLAIAKLNGRLGYIKTWFSKDIRKTWPKEKASSISYWIAIGICIFIAFIIEVAGQLH